jgi:hypothetical protein
MIVCNKANVSYILETKNEKNLSPSHFLSSQTQWYCLVVQNSPYSENLSSSSTTTTFTVTQKYVAHELSNQITKFQCHYSVAATAQVC